VQVEEKGNEEEDASGEEEKGTCRPSTDIII
jgi:hypothetical protein